jgi:hypothetical protein
MAKSSDPTFDVPNAAMFSAIELNIGILCACLPTLRPLLSAMLPSYFPTAAPYRNVETQDVERTKHQRYPTASSFTYAPGTAKRSYHSRTGSSSTRTNSPRYGHSRVGSKGSSRSYLGTDSELEVIRAPQASFVGTGRPKLVPVRSTPKASAHTDHQVHPLRMSPFQPVIPRLPRLPERMSTFSPIEPVFRSPRQSRHQRQPSRTPVSHKPLPITPFPVMHGL